MTGNKLYSSDYARPGRCRAGMCGFTLIEMLISVSLVLVIMLLFTQVFQIATESLSKQRGLAENDQRARMLTTLVRSDISKRTFVDVIPFLSGQDTTTLDLTRRSGYFYYAENNPGDDTDDILQFTAQSLRHARNSDASPYVGKATLLANTAFSISSENATLNQLYVAGDLTSILGDVAYIWVYGSANSSTGASNDGRFKLAVAPAFNSGMGATVFSIDVSQLVYVMDSAMHGMLCVAEDQPEIDDGVAGNSIGQASAVEVSYFLRGSNLYRRVLLLRDAGPDGAQPQYADGTAVIAGAYAPAFWNDFDHSAYYFRGYFDGSGLTGAGPRFNNSSSSLSNDSNSAKELVFAAPPSAPFQPSDQYRIVSLGCPQNRFGHDPWTGLPREFMNAGSDGLYWTSDDSIYIGRYTISECANSAFRYPGGMTVGALSDPSQDVSPMSVNQNLSVTNQSVDAYSAGAVRRRGEDLLLSNVLGFDVKLWDPLVDGGTFVDLGARSNGVYGYLSLANSLYCPINGAAPGPGNVKYRYDTWHPGAQVIQSGSPGVRRTSPPFLNQFDSTNSYQVPLKAIQIAITYRDRSSDLVRQLTIVQSLVDK